MSDKTTPVRFTEKELQRIVWVTNWDNPPEIDRAIEDKCHKALERLR